MFSQGLSHFTNISLVNFGLILFLAAFVVILLRTLKGKGKYFDVAQLPLTEEEDRHERR